MKSAMQTTLTVFRVTGLFQLVLGTVFWTGHALNLVPLHSTIGLVFVVSMWVLAGLGARTGTPAGLVALALVWSLIVPLLGMTQIRLVPGDWHWTIRLLHLLVGMAAMGIGDRVARSTIAPLRIQPRPRVVAGWPEGGGL